MNTVTFTESALILIREGAEALLIIAALAAYLNRTGLTEKIRVLYWGAGWALVASGITAVIFEYFFGGNHNDLLESVTMLLAAGVLVYVSGWLFFKRDAANWQKYLHDKVGNAVSNTNMWALGSVAFLAVYREGAETILFLQATAIKGGGWTPSLIAGLLAGAAVLLAVFLAVRKLALRLPFKPFFIATAAFLYVLALLFTGQGILEFQEMGWVSLTELSAVPGWLVDIGVNPTVESVTVQVLMILAVPLTIVYEQRRLAASEAQG
ncbi:MAG: FTR1 family protein [Rhodospirillales bacterium]|nr:FTR1 family protein [Rhodospirillales bacterium]